MTKAVPLAMIIKTILLSNLDDFDGGRIALSEISAYKPGKVSFYMFCEYDVIMKSALPFTAEFFGRNILTHKRKVQKHEAKLIFLSFFVCQNISKVAIV